MTASKLLRNVAKSAALLATSDETSRTVPPWNTKIRALGPDAIVATATTYYIPCRQEIKTGHFHSPAGKS